MKNSTKFQLTATKAVEYSLEYGWRMADTIEEKSEIFDTEKSALDFKDEFVKSLKMSAFEVFEIDINEVIVAIDEHGDDVIEIVNSESIDIIDGSAEEGNSFGYILTQEFGQYMIPTGKYHLDYARHNLTRNEWLTRTENPSFRSSVMEVFKTEECVKDYLQQNDIYVKTSVIELTEEED
nr:hypothetical protein [uncultured Pedobacter sp.]